MSAKPIYKVVMDNKGNGVFANILGRWENGDVVYDERSTLFNPKLSIEINEAGSFEFTMPKTHDAYEYPELYSTTVEVYELGRDDTHPDTTSYMSVFYGRVISISTDNFLQKTVRCEGCLAFFKDHLITKENSIHHGSVNIVDFFKDILTDYRDKHTCPSNRKFNTHVETAGGQDVPGRDVYRATIEYENCWDVIDQKILKAEGGYLLFSRSKTLDFQTMPSNTQTNVIWICPEDDDPYPSYVNNAQSIRYSVNLISASKNNEVEDIYTRIFPIYKYEDESTGKTKYNTIKGVTYQGITGNSCLELSVYANATVDILDKTKDVCPATITLKVKTNGANLDFTYRGSTVTTSSTSYISLGESFINDNPAIDSDSVELDIKVHEGDTTELPQAFIQIYFNNIGTSYDGTTSCIEKMSALKKYGIIAEAVEISNSGYEELPRKSTTDRKKLLYKEGVKYLNRIDFRANSIEVSAAEMAYLKPTITPYRLGDGVHINSTPHGIQTTKLTITKLEYSLDSATKKVTLGTPQTVTLTEYYRKKKKDYTEEYTISSDDG